MTEHNRKKLTPPENPPPSSATARPLTDTAVPQPETAIPGVAFPPESADPSVTTDPLAPPAGTPLPEASDKVAPPEGDGNWRSHIFFFWLSIVGTVGTLVGVVLSVYFYQASQIKPMLTFGVHPLKTELQRPDYDKELGFIYRGKPIDSESITSVQVSIWNAGTRSIRDSDVLDPFRLAMPDGSAILRARVKKTSRAICSFECLDNQDDYKSGICRLKWRILEPGDGAILQIIYAGSARRDPTLEGAVEGQRDGVIVEKYDLTLDRTHIMPSNFSLTRLGAILVLFLIAILLIFIVSRISKTEAAKKLAEEKAEAEKHLAELRKRTVPAPPVVWVLVAGAFVCLVCAMLLLFFGMWSTPGPPFGW